MFGLHVFSSVQAGRIAVRGGPLMAASDKFTIDVHGRQTHGSAPWGGVDPIVAAADLVGTAQTVVSRRSNISKQPAVVSFGSVHGGIRYNIIPDSVQLVGTIRTFDEAIRARIHADLDNVANHVAASPAAPVTPHIPVRTGHPGTANNPHLTARMLPTLPPPPGPDH